MIRRTFLTTVAAIGLFSIAGSAMAQEPLRIGIEASYKPFSWKEPDGTLTGFDIDMARALCAELERECVLVEQDWDGMIPALLANKFDAIVASMSITEERKRVIDFTDKYYETSARVVAPKSLELTIDAAGLAGKRLGVQRGTTHQCYAEKMFPDTEIVLYTTQEEVFRDLELGRIDAQLSDSLTAYESFLKTENGAKFEFKGDYQRDPECYGKGEGIAVRKEDSELRDALSAAIKELRANGTYAEINAKYFPFDIYGEE